MLMHSVLCIDRCVCDFDVDAQMHCGDIGLFCGDTGLFCGDVTHMYVDAQCSLSNHISHLFKNVCVCVYVCVCVCVCSCLCG